MKRVLIVALAGVALGGCTAAVPADSADQSSRLAPHSSHAMSAAVATPSTEPSSSRARRHRVRTRPSSLPASTVAVLPTPSSPPPSVPPTDPATSSPAPVANASGKPVIVLDPGHSVTVTATDPRTHLNVSDYENEPEMRDVFAVALIVRRRLEAAGYRVVMTKKTLDQRASLLHRAQVANRVHAALALSIHDQAGSNGGIGFDEGNNTVYYQSVGGYRVNERGQRIVFRDRPVARLSRRYGHIFRRQRSAVEHHAVALRGNVGYNLGSRGLAAGDMWMVQLLSRVPWIYDEAGGNSAGRVGLSAHDKRLYAAGLVASVEHCIPLQR